MDHVACLLCEAHFIFLMSRPKHAWQLHTHSNVAHLVGQACECINHFVVGEDVRTHQLGFSVLTLLVIKTGIPKQPGLSEVSRSSHSAEGDALWESIWHIWSRQRVQRYEKRLWRIDWPPRTPYTSPAWSLWCVSVRCDIIRSSLLLLLRDMTVGLEYDDMQTWLSSLNCRLSFLPPHPGGINEYEVDLGNEEETEVFLKTHHEVQLNWPKPNCWNQYRHLNAGHLPRSDISCLQWALCNGTCFPCIWASEPAWVSSAFVMLMLESMAAI